MRYFVTALVLLAAACGQAGVGVQNNDSGTIDASVLPETCGNGGIDLGEECDGLNLGIATCQIVGNYMGGNLSCTDTCKFDTSQCQRYPDCGDGDVDTDEECDGADLDDQNCTTIGSGYISGTLACQHDCTFDTSGCVIQNPYCGNGLIDVGEGEECDGDAFADVNDSCLNRGFDAGTLACSNVCTVDTSGCYDIPIDCGNGAIDLGEECDGLNLGVATCTMLGFSGGVLACNADCTFDAGACTAPPVGCGDGVKNSNEECDGVDLGGATCWTIPGFAGGTLACTSTCSFDVSRCAEIIYQPAGGMPKILAFDGDDIVLTQGPYSGSGFYTLATIPKTGGPYYTIGYDDVNVAKVDSLRIYYSYVNSSTDKGIRAYIKGAGNTVTLGVAAHGTLVGQDTTHIYSLSSGRVYSHAKNGGGSSLVFTDIADCTTTTNFLPTMNSNRMFWSSNCSGVGVIRHWAFVNTTASSISLAPIDQIYGCAVDEDNVLWYARNGTNNWVIGKTVIVTSNDTVLTPNQGSGIRNLTLDATHVYWWIPSSNTAFPDGELRRVPIAGGPVETLVTGIHSPYSLAVDATHIYWTTAQNSSVVPEQPALILRLAKP